MSLRVHLTEPGVPVEPGGEGVAAVTVVNTSPVVRAYRLDLVGVAGWAFVEPREVRLFPEQAGDALVHFRPPKSPEVTSGAHAFAVKVTATDEDALSTVEEGTVNVAPWCAADLTVRPKTARGSRKAKYRLILTNTGNTRQRFDLSAADEDEMLELKLHHDEVGLDPGETKAVAMVARTYGRVSRGERLPFTATVQGPGLTPTSANGALAIAPALGPWLVRAAIALFALALVVGGFMLARNTNPQTGAREFKAEATSTSLQPGIPSAPAATTPETTAPPAAAPPDNPTAATPPAATPPPATAPPAAPPATPAPTAAPKPTTTTPQIVLSIVTMAPIIVIPSIVTTAPPPPPVPTAGAIYARVLANGVMLNSNAGATSSGSGAYTVTFPGTDLSSCAYNVMVSAFYGQANPGPQLAYVARKLPSTNQLYVETKNQGGGLSPASFTVMVHCAAAASSFAVVNENGAVTRSSNVTSVARTGVGAYRINVNYDASKCSVVVGQGDPADDADYINDIYAPRVVGVSGVGVRYIDVMARDLAGGPVDASFHAVVRCGTYAANGTFNGAGQVLVNGNVSFGGVISGTYALGVPGLNTSGCGVVASTRDTGAGGFAMATFSNASFTVSTWQPHAPSATSSERTISVFVSC